MGSGSGNRAKDRIRFYGGKLIRLISCKQLVDSIGEGSLAGFKIVRAHRDLAGRIETTFTDHRRHRRNRLLAINASEFVSE